MNYWKTNSTMLDFYTKNVGRMAKVKKQELSARQGASFELLIVFVDLTKKAFHFVFFHLFPKNLNFECSKLTV